MATRALFLFSVTVVFASERAPIRVTQFGKISGKVTSRINGSEVEEFLGIPYAAPPIGKLRFQVSKNNLMSLRICLFARKYKPCHDRN